MRKAGLGIASLLLLTGCRPQAISPEVRAAEYGVFHDWLQTESLDLSPDVQLAVADSTYEMREGRLRFQRCLPERMQALYDGDRPATLVASGRPGWLTVSNRPALPLVSPWRTDGLSPSETIAFSRVAFTRLSPEAYVWVSRTSCAPGVGSAAGCQEVGALLHATRSGESWSFEPTDCTTATY